MAAMGNDMHIDAPHLVSHRRRLTDAVATAVMWVIYSYLWAPFISLVAWLLGFEFAYDVMVRAGGANGLLSILYWYGVVLLCIFVVVTGWSAINRHRFAGLDRRQSVIDITDDELAEHFAIDLEILQKLRSSRNAVVSINETGGIENVEILERGYNRD